MTNAVKNFRSGVCFFSYRFSHGKKIKVAFDKWKVFFFSDEK